MRPELTAGWCAPAARQPFRGHSLIIPNSVLSCSGSGAVRCNDPKVVNVAAKASRSSSDGSWMRLAPCPLSEVMPPGFTYRPLGSIRRCGHQPYE